jgi:hypothetical protein
LYLRWQMKHLQLAIRYALCLAFLAATGCRAKPKSQIVGEPSPRSAALSAEHLQSNSTTKFIAVTESAPAGKIPEGSVS